MLGCSLTVKCAHERGSAPASTPGQAGSPKVGEGPAASACFGDGSHDVAKKLPV